MTAINITNARKELYNLVENVNRYSDPTLISKKGNAILISEDDWNAIQRNSVFEFNSWNGRIFNTRQGIFIRRIV